LAKSLILHTIYQSGELVRQLPVNSRTSRTQTTDADYAAFTLLVPKTEFEAKERIYIGHAVFPGPKDSFRRKSPAGVKKALSF
jgi:hypothetical protein